MFAKVLVANRGAVAARIVRALSEMNVRSVAVYSEVDRDNPYVGQASEAYAIGPASARESYLNIEALIEVARSSGADAVHPGYGFLSESPEFARRIEAAGLQFIGPAADVIEAMGNKVQARDLVRRHGMPVGAGSGTLSGDAAEAAAEAERIGYPVIVKPAGGGGGIGMLIARNADELASAVERASSLAARSFGNGEVYLERLIDKPRHVEVQILADRFGTVRHLYERDCSVQRRHQKVIEEARAPGVPRERIEALGDGICRTLQRIGYDNIGTVEMLMDAEGEFHFLEMNTRLQVEHGVTEEITGIDLVRMQIATAAGQKLADLLPAAVKPVGHAIQARIYAEDPKRFLPSAGTLKVFRLPVMDGVRIDTGYAESNAITPYYDPLVAKVIAAAPTRDQARLKLLEALQAFEIEGIRHNVPALVAVLQSPAFRAGEVHTGLLPQVLG
jgi:acetyl-CoA carboxylase biotin carboxylase subunit